MLSDELNEIAACPSVSRGKVTLVDYDSKPLLPQPKGEGFLDAHPELSASRNKGEHHDFRQKCVFCNQESVHRDR